MSAIRNFEVLSEHECRQLLAGQDVGWVGDDRSVIIMSATPPTSSLYGDGDE
jgi:hypothetical protein